MVATSYGEQLLTRVFTCVCGYSPRAHGSTAIRGSGGLGRYISPAGELHQLGCGSFACCLRTLVGVVRSALCNC